MSNYANPKCYAASIKGCSRKITREHFVSDAVLRIIGSDGLVMTAGLPWQKTSNGEKLPINQLASNILCDAHNSILSPLDDEAVRLFRFLQPFWRGTQTASNSSISADGRLLELWMLKTLCGFLASKNSPSHNRADSTLWVPPDWWIEVLFKKIPIHATVGLYFYGGGPPHTEQSGPSGFGYSPLSQQGLGVYGAIMSLYSAQFIFAMAQPPATMTGTLLEHATFHPSKISFADGRFLNELNLTWGGAKAGRAIIIRHNRS